LPVNDRTFSLPSPPPIEYQEDEKPYYSFNLSPICEFSPTFQDSQFQHRIVDLSQPTVSTFSVSSYIRAEADSTQSDYDDISSVSSFEFEDNLSYQDSASDYDSNGNVMQEATFDAPVVQGVNDLEYVGISNFHQLHLAFGLADLLFYHSESNGIFVLKITNKKNFNFL
jgi:hypothetical protein